MMTEEEISEMKKVPEWMKNKMDKHYVHSEIVPCPDGKTVEWTISVGDRVVVSLEGKRHPETEEEWQRMSDILEIDHYVNWMKRFCEQMSLIGDEDVKKAVKNVSVPTDEEFDRMLDGKLTFGERVERIVDRLMTSNSWSVRYFWILVGALLGWAFNRYVLNVIL